MSYIISYSPHVRWRTSPLSTRREGKSIADARGEYSLQDYENTKSLSSNYLV